MLSKHMVYHLETKFACGNCDYKANRKDSLIIMTRKKVKNKIINC